VIWNSSPQPTTKRQHWWCKFEFLFDKDMAKREESEISDKRINRKFCGTIRARFLAIGMDSERASDTRIGSKFQSWTNSRPTDKIMISKEHVLSNVL